VRLTILFDKAPELAELALDCWSREGGDVCDGGGHGCCCDRVEGALVEQRVDRRLSKPLRLDVLTSCAQSPHE
jgi:hypothetical protein